MIYVQSIQKLLLGNILLLSMIFSQECTELNPNDYGDCGNSLGFVWTGNDCLSVYGCGNENDIEFFFNTYEECDITCNYETSLGDLNGDSVINIVDNSIYYWICLLQLFLS